MPNQHNPNQEPRIWAFKTVSDEDRKYRSIGTYPDKPSHEYAYDNFVANHKQVQEGDVVLVINKERILGVARISGIRAMPTTKLRNRCPKCGDTSYIERSTKAPRYRCTKADCHEEFDVLETKTVNATQYIASYGTTFKEPQQQIAISVLRPFYSKGYNGNMSIQRLDKGLFGTDGLSEFSEQFEMDVPQNLKPTEADDTTELGEDNPDLEQADNRPSVAQQIKARRGQTKFRNDLRKRYGDICMVTGCQILDILEAAHIKPYRGPKDNHPTNGLLLRADIHTLFDLNLIGIEPKSLTIHVHPRIQLDEYGSLNGQALKATLRKTPDKGVLRTRWQFFCKRTEEV